MKVSQATMIAQHLQTENLPMNKAFRTRKSMFTKNLISFPSATQLFKTFDVMGNCNVTIKVDDRSFVAHRNILASAIPYFRTMFLNNMVESMKKEITLHGIEADAMEVLIDFAYSGKIILTNKNVQSIMEGASYLALNEVKDDCAEFLQTLFDPQNVLGIRRFADHLSCVQLVNNADRYIRKFFREFAQEEEFLDLPLEYLKELICREDLCISSEELIFEAVMRWIKHSIERRSEKLVELLSLVKLPLLSPEYLMDHVAKEKLIRVSDPCRDLLDEASSYYLLPKRRKMMDQFRCHPRRSLVMGHIYAVGENSNRPPCVVEVFDPFKGHWETMKPMTILRNQFGVAVHNGKLYAFGGKNKRQTLNSSEVFDPVTSTWLEIAPMKCKRRHDSVITLNSVERLSLETNTWKKVRAMNKCRYGAGIVACQGHIYAIGGYDGSVHSDTVERYDPNSNTWVFLQPMSTPRSHLGVAILNEKLYACGGWDGLTYLRTVEVYDPSLDRWDFVASMNNKRGFLAVVANMGKLWGIGGFDGTSDLSIVENYDPEKNEWSFVEPMRAIKGGVRAGVIHIC